MTTMNSTNPQAQQPQQTLEPIPTPMKLQWRRIRYQLIPAIVFVVALVATAWLWRHHQSAPHGVGEVSMESVKINAPHDGKLMPVEDLPRLYDRVEAGRMVARLEADQLIGQQEQLQEQLEKRQNDLDKARRAYEEAVAAKDKARSDLLKLQVDTLQQQVEAQRAEFARISKRVTGAVLTAPVAGTITSVVRNPNEFVKQGDEIMTITQDTGGYIVSYVRESASVPKKDDVVVVRSQTSLKSATSRVQEVGTQVQLIPEHQLSNPKRPEWGIPVRIAMPPAAALPLRPGELVVLNYQGAGK